MTTTSVKVQPSPRTGKRDLPMAAPPGTRSPVLLVSQFFPPAVGGSAMLLSNVYSRIAADVAVLTDAESSPGTGEVQGPFRIRRDALQTPHWGLLHPAGLLHHLRTARRIRELCGERTVVHCARVLPEGVAAWMARRLGGPRYVCWSHGEDIATATTSRELGLTTRLVLRGAEASLANSHNTARILEELGVPPGEIHVAHPGVDATRFHPEVDGRELRRTLDPGGKACVLLSVGRLQLRKGHDLVIRAMAARRPDDSPLRFVIVGSGEEEPRLRALAADCGVSDEVVFAGKVPDEDLPAYYAACDVFVMPNRQEGEDIEGFGIVFLEAQASGRPVIGGTTGGAPEAIAAGRTGLLVSGTDADELGEAIGKLAASPELRRSLGRAGRERVLSEFTWERAAAVVTELVARLDRRP